jgi:hypothetical protein
LSKLRNAHISREKEWGVLTVLEKRIPVNFLASSSKQGDTAHQEKPTDKSYPSKSRPASGNSTVSMQASAFP